MLAFHQGLITFEESEVDMIRVLPLDVEVVGPIVVVTHDIPVVGENRFTVLFHHRFLFSFPGHSAGVKLRRTWKDRGLPA